MFTLLYLKWITNKDLLLALEHRELCSMLCGSLDGTGVWGRMDTCIYMADFLCCSPETTTTLLISYTPIQNKTFQFKKKKKKEEINTCPKCSDNWKKKIWLVLVTKIYQNVIISTVHTLTTLTGMLCNKSLQI